MNAYANQTMSLLDAKNTFYRAVQVLASYSLNALTPAKNWTIWFFPECFSVFAE